MSQETSEWLNTQTVVGFTDQRGHAWHYREGANNHYADAIPVEVVSELLKRVAPTKEPVYVKVGDQYEEITDRKAIMNGDDCFGVFTNGYQIHDYQQWLVDNVFTLVGTQLGIGSAGLLQRGSVAWVQLELPENMRTPSGLDYRPNLVAFTSLNGKFATGYKETNQVVVCDNTLEGARSEDSREWKIRHSRHSLNKMDEAREALAIEFITERATDFEAWSEELAHWKISDKQFSKWLALAVPIPDGDSKGERAARTRAEKRQDDYWQLWEQDERVTPWKRTALGVVQVSNTYAHHMMGTRGQSRPERNMLNAITGKTSDSDTETLAILSDVAPKPQLATAS